MNLYPPSRPQNHKSLVTINQQTIYNSGILRQDYRIIQDLAMHYMRFADWVTIWVVHLPEWTETDEPNYCIKSDCASPV